MRGDGDEAIAHAVELQQTIVQQRALDPQRRALRGGLEQVGLVRRESSRYERSDVDHAEHASAREQRRAEERLDPLLPEDRVEHVRVVDVLDRDRPALRRETTGEASADRDADAGFDLLLETRGRAGDELVPPLVEQQDRARVGLEEVAHADDELVEQVGRREVRERDVGHAARSRPSRSANARSLSKQSSVRDRERRAVGDELEQLGVLSVNTRGVRVPTCTTPMTRRRPGAARRGAT